MSAVDERPRAAAPAPEEPAPAVAGRTPEEWCAIDPARAWRVTRLLTSWIWVLVSRVRTYGLENLPASGGFLFVPNHSSWFDQFYQSYHQRRLLRFMTKATIFRVPVVAWYLRRMGAFPIARDKGDQHALDVARALLRDGQPVVVYPEGVRFRRDDDLGPARRGAARLALETGAPVLPVATYGARPSRSRGQHRFRRPKVTTLYGPLMHFEGIEPTLENVERVRDEIWAEVARLYELARSIHRDRPAADDWVVPARP
jgi:1-acyl-sn-glycerol-3-phosphate acyltransferase